MNKKILTPLFVAASFLLIGCSTSEIVGRPSWVNDPIVVNPTDLKDNTLKEIYDAIKKLGDTNANVLDKVMYDIAKKNIGTFIELAKFKEDSADATEFNKFVENHPIYKSDDRGAQIVDGETVFRDLTPEEKTKVSRIKIEQQYNAIVESIFEKLFNDIKGGSYNTDATFKLFSEDVYVRHLKKELYDPVVPEGCDLTKGKQTFLPKPTGSTWKNYVNFIDSSTTDTGFLHVIDNANKFTSIYAKEVKDENGNVIDYDGYIGRKILPEIYREILIEAYVHEQRATNLGRSYARKVKMLTIPRGSYPTQVNKMLIDYVKNHVTGDPSAEPEPLMPTLGNLDELSDAMIGYANDTVGADTKKHLDAGGFSTYKVGDQNLKLYMSVDKNGTPITPTNETFSYAYKGTKIGDIVDKLTKAYTLTYSATDGTLGNFTYTPKVPSTSESESAYNDLTNNGAYPLEVGLEIKEREALLTDMTQDGWYLKDGGLTDLNEDSRNRLFNITTSNQIDSKTSTTYESGDYIRYFDIESESDAFLIKGSTEEKVVWESVILNDDNNFYIVQVDEAASSSKLSYEDEDGSYLAKKATADITQSNKAMNDIVHNITKQVAKSDTYKKNAEQYYLMISNILFYDQSVYDYFKSQFPDLFK